MADSIKFSKGWTFGSVPSGILESELSTHAKLLAAAITFHAFSGGKAWPGLDRLGRLCSCSGRRVQDAVKELEGAGWVKVTKQQGRSNTYEMLEKTTEPGSGVYSMPQNDVPGTPEQSSVVLAKPRNHVPPNENKTRTREKNEGPALTRRLSDLWVKLFAQQWSRPYHFAGAKDGQALTKLADYFTQLAKNQPTRPPDYVPTADDVCRVFEHGVLNVWATCHRDRYLSAVTKTVAGFASVLNQVDLGVSTTVTFKTKSRRLEA